MSRKKQPHNLRPPLSPPPLETYDKGTFREQFNAWRRAKDQLNPQVRSSFKKRGQSPMRIEDCKQVILYIENLWTEQRRQCHENHDYFEWPTTIAWLGDGSLTTSEWDKEGALLLFGYQVSQEANLNEETRRRRLDDVFNAVIPPFTDWSRLAEWGEPRTPQRLKKMANSIAAFARNAKRRQNPHFASAIRKWESDLDYLRLKFYQGVFGFEWPDTRLI